MYTLSSSGKISAVWYSGTLNSKNKRLFSIRHCTIIGIIQYKQLNKLQNVAVIYINIKIHIDLYHFCYQYSLFRGWSYIGIGNTVRIKIFLWGSIFVTFHHLSIPFKIVPRYSRGKYNSLWIETLFVILCVLILSALNNSYTKTITIKWDIKLNSCNKHINYFIKRQVNFIVISF
jgi:hypothetical protein